MRKDILEYVRQEKGKDNNSQYFTVEFLCFMGYEYIPTGGMVQRETLYIFAERFIAHSARRHLNMWKQDM